MLIVTNEIPTRCCRCDSDALEKTFSEFPLNGQHYSCIYCGFTMVYQREWENEGSSLISASVEACPHCATVGEICVEEGEEWCKGCGLNPNNRYPLLELSHLWNPGSAIRRVMEKDSSTGGLDKIYGSFLRKFCGPHCEFAKDCEQKLINLSICRREEDPKGDSKDVMSRKNRHKHRHKGRSSTRPIQREAAVECAQAGWFAQKLSDRKNYDTENKQSPGSPEGRPGT